MARFSLTDRFAAGAKAGPGGRTDYFDEKSPGLALRVSSAGAKVWTLHFTSPKDGKRARMTLGGYPAVTLAAARTRASEARTHLEARQDPRDMALGQAGDTMTVAALVKAYIEMHVSTLRSSAGTSRRFIVNIVPVIGNVRLGDLHRRDISRVVDPIMRRGAPMEASHALGDMRALLRWAVSRGDLDRNPADGMRKPAVSKPRERALAEEEIITLWHSLPSSLARSPTCQRILKLCLVTAQRVGEVSGMALAELDLPNGQWTIPAARSKNGFAHIVPLSAMAVSIIKEAISAAGTSPRFVFPNSEGIGAMPAIAVARTISRAHQVTAEYPAGRFGIAHWTAHDLRRTAVSAMAQLGVSPIVLGHVINHRSVTRAGVTLAVYARYSYEKEKREALELWADRLVAIVAGNAAKVVALRG